MLNFHYRHKFTIFVIQIWIVENYATNLRFAYTMDEKQVISIIPYAGGGDLLTDARTIIDGARQYAYSSVNVALVQRN